MSDILQTAAVAKQAEQNSRETVYTATAKPLEKKPHHAITAIFPLEQVADTLRASQVLDRGKLAEFTARIEQQQAALDSKTRAAVTTNLALLKREMDTLETLEIVDVLAAADGPWGAFIRDIAQSDRLKQSIPDAKQRELYVSKLFFPFGASILRTIRSMTTDPLTGELMFNAILDEIQDNTKAIALAQASLPQPKDTTPTKHTMRRIALQLLGTKLDGHESDAQIDALYKKGIHTAVLKSRLSAEQPLFDIKLTEHMLLEAEHNAKHTLMPFAKEEAARVVRETQERLKEMKRIRALIDAELQNVRDEPSLMRALDAVQAARFEDPDIIAPYKFEPWVPDHVRTDARRQLALLTQPKEDLYAKVLKKLDAAQRRFKENPNTWSKQRYDDHMRWLADPVAQATRKQRILNIIDLTLTITTLVSGITGGIQRTIEGAPAKPATITDVIAQLEQQRPWEVAADLASPKIPKVELG